MLGASLFNVIEFSFLPQEVTVSCKEVNPLVQSVPNMASIILVTTFQRLKNHDII